MDIADKRAGADQKLIAIALVLVAMLAFAVMDGLAKHVAVSLAIPQILLVRYLVFAVLVLAIIRLQRHRIRTVATSTRPGLQLFRALLLLCESTCFMIAFRYLPLADVHAIAAAAPLVVVAMSFLLLGEPVGPRRIAAVLAGFAGVLLIVRPGFAELNTGVLVSMLAAFLWGAYQIVVRLCARNDSAATTTVWTALVGFGVAAALGPYHWIWPSQEQWIYLIAIAALGALAHVTLIKALSLAEAALLQPYSYTLFIWTIGVGYLMFGDLPDSWTLAGAAIIIASGVYVWHRERTLIPNETSKS